VTATDELRGQMHELLDHGFDTPPLGKMSDGALLAQQADQAIHRRML
jgi:hypothetical protein